MTAAQHKSWLIGLASWVLVPLAAQAAPAFESVGSIARSAPREHVLDLRPTPAASAPQSAPASAPEALPSIPLINAAAASGVAPSAASAPQAASAAAAGAQPAVEPLPTFGTMAQAARAGIQPMPPDRPASAAVLAAPVQPDAQADSVLQRLTAQARALLSTPVQDWLPLLQTSPELLLLAAAVLGGTVFLVVLGKRSANA